MILILSRAEDPHTHVVQRALAARGVRSVCFNPRSFPSLARLTIEWQAGRSFLELVDQGRPLDLDEIKTVWLRRPQGPIAVPGASPEAGEAVEQSTLALGDLLSNRFWVNDYLRQRAAIAKPYQLWAALRAGMDIPRTLVTNSPKDALAFYADCGGRVIYKTFGGLRGAEEGVTPRAAFTSRVTPELLRHGLQSIQLAPCTFQEELSKARECRVTVVGQEVFAAEVVPSDGAELGIDYRRDLDAIKMRSCELEKGTQAALVAMFGSLGLVFGCVDLIDTRDGRTVFLEVNPSGQWYGVQLRTGLPILASLVDMLVRGRA